MNKERFLQLDGLKGIFCIIILLYHLSGLVYSDYDMLPFTKILYPIYKYGGYGTEIFFIISGFLIAHTYKNKITNTSLFSFLHYRLRNIFILAGVTNVCMVGLKLVDKYKFNNVVLDNINIDADRFLLHLLCMGAGWYDDRGISPSWYIEVLILCYIIFYIINKINEKTNIYTYLILMMICIGIALIYEESKIPFLYRVNGRGYLSFFMGCLLFEIYIKFSSYFQNQVVIWGYIIIIGLAVLTNKIGIEVLGNLYILVSILIYPVIILSALNISCIKKLLSIRMFTFFGKYSISLYLWQYPIIFGIKLLNYYYKLNINFKSFIIFGNIIVVIVMVSMLSYHLLERRLIPRINNWFNNVLTKEQIK